MQQIIKLSTADVARAALVANARNFRKESKGIRSRKVATGHGEFEAHLIGVCGEIAGAIALGAKIDESSSDGGDDGTDVTAYGKTFQIKTTTYSGKGHPSLKFNSREEFTADVAMLVRKVSEDEYEIVGVVSRARFEKIAVVKNYGYGDKLCVEAPQLTPLAKMIEIETGKSEKASTTVVVDPECLRARAMSCAEWVAEYEAYEKPIG